MPGLFNLQCSAAFPSADPKYPAGQGHPSDAILKSPTSQIQKLCLALNERPTPSSPRVETTLRDRMSVFSIIHIHASSLFNS